MLQPDSALPGKLSGPYTELFAAFNGASWAVQSRDREGQLQEIMTSQVMQAVAGAVNSTSLMPPAGQR